MHGGARCSRSGDDDALPSRLVKAVSCSAAGKPINGLPELEREVLSLLHCLHEAYSEAGFQSEVAEVKRAAGGDALRHVTALGPLAARAQAPVFASFGLPPGQRGVMLMKAGVKVLARANAEMAGLAGDLRELLGLQREEEDTVALMKKAEAGFVDLVAKVQKAPVDVRGPLAEALCLPYSASAEDIAREVPRIKSRARDVAEKHLKRGRAELIGPGKVLPLEMEGASDEELLSELVKMFEHYLQKMLARVVTSVDSFTRPPRDFRCSWAMDLVNQRHARELWGEEQPGGHPPSSPPWEPEWPEVLGWGGLTILDSAVDASLAQAARVELDELERCGRVTASKDPCNIGAQSAWLHFETQQERQQVPPALLELCLRLAGLPLALEEAAAHCKLPAPRLRIHPHVMAATYRQGSEYHCHKDSYGGADNQRMLSVLLYLNEGWQVGDAGELRVFAGKSEGGPDEGRYVDIAPLCGRLVLFRAREVWHAVREPRKQRWALTLWVMAD